MADVIKTSSTLKLLAAFADEDDRTLLISNPRNDIKLSEINELAELIQTKQLIIGDKYGAAFTRFKESKIVRETIRKFDLGN